MKKDLALIHRAVLYDVSPRHRHPTPTSEKNESQLRVQEKRDTTIVNVTLETLMVTAVHHIGTDRKASRSHGTKTG